MEEAIVVSHHVIVSGRGPGVTYELQSDNGSYKILRDQKEVALLTMNENGQWQQIKGRRFSASSIISFGQMIDIFFKQLPA